MNIRDYLTEVFDGPYKWRKGKDVFDIQKFVFDVGNDTYTVNLREKENKATQKFLVIEFLPESEDNHPFDILGGHEKDSLRIFSTVWNIVEKYVKEHPKLRYLFFAAKEPSRVRLYNMMGKRIEKMGWERLHKDRDTIDFITGWTYSGLEEELYLYRRK